MPFAIVELETSPADIPPALDHLARVAPDIHAMAGNIAFRALATETGVVILQEWRSAADFDVYRASAVFAAMGDVLRPLASQPPNSRLFEEVIAS